MQGGSILGRESRCLGGFALDFESVPSTLTSIPRLGLPQLWRTKRQQLRPLFSLTFWKMLLQCGRYCFPGTSGPPPLSPYHPYSSGACRRQVHHGQQQDRGMRSSVSHDGSVGRHISTPMNLDSNTPDGEAQCISVGGFCQVSVTCR